MTYFFFYACEIFNKAYLRDYQVDKMTVLGVTIFFLQEQGDNEYMTRESLAGFDFFFYAVHVRSKCLEFLRGSPKMERPTESFVDFLKNLRPSEVKIPKSKL